MDTKECFSEKTLDGQLYEIYIAALGGSGGDGSFVATKGVASMANGTSNHSVNFTSNIGTASYSVVVTIENTVDPTVRHLVPVITSKTSNGFAFVTSQTTDHANYKANYIVVKL